MPGWKSKYRQFVTSFFACMAVFCSSSSFVWPAPLLGRLQEGSPDVGMNLSHTEASWVVSLIEIGNMITPIPSAFVADLIGRKIVLLSIAPMYIITWLLVLYTRTVSVLYVVRVVQGLGLGVVYTIVPTYLAEMAEPKLRGVLSVIFVGMWFLGILMVYCVGPYTSYQTFTWICFSAPVFFLLTFWYFPESPYYLMLREKEEKTKSALFWLRGTRDEDEVMAEMEDISNSIEEERRAGLALKDLFVKRQGWKALLLAQVVAVTQSLAGFTAVLQYATDTLYKVRADLLDPNVCSILIGLGTLVSTVISGGLVDHLGRRPVLVSSGFGSFIMLTLTAVYFFLAEKTDLNLKNWSWIPYVTLILFMAIINMGLAALLTTLQAELFPTVTRNLASGITALNLCITSFVMLKLYIPIQDSVGVYLNYVFFAIFACVGSTLIYLFLPETKGKTFQEIQELL